MHDTHRWKQHWSQENFKHYDDHSNKRQRWSSFLKNILLNLTEECLGGSKQHFQSFLLEIRRLVLFTAKDVKDDTLEAATKLFASKIRYMNSDGASEMRKLATFIQSWQEMFGVWLKYLSHVVEGFEKEADKLLCDWEASTKVYKRITNDWT